MEGKTCPVCEWVEWGGGGWGRIIQSFKRLCCLSAVARLKQTTCQREWVFTTPALTSGSTLTGCERRRARVGGRRSAAGTVSPVWFWYCFTGILRSPLTQPWAFFTDILFLSHSFIHPLSSWTKFDGGDGGRGGGGRGRGGFHEPAPCGRRH